MNSEARIGQVIGGRFRLVRLLGEGGMGAVYEAEHAGLPRRFAVKVLREDMALDKRFVERFRREAIASSRLQHPHIVEINDFGQTDDQNWYMVMEFLIGESVDDIIRKKGPMSLARVVPILIQLSDAVDHAHKVGVIHRDLKPENILLTTQDGQADFAKILDFGIARIQSYAHQERLTLQGQIFGTAEYVSPEQAMDQDIDGRSDLYALGIMAYEMTTGRCPFEGNAADVLMAHLSRAPQPPSAHAQLPPAFDEIVVKCLMKKPADRYQSGGELRRDLLRLRAMLVGVPDGMMRPGAAPVRGRRRVADVSGWRPLGSRPPPESLIAEAPRGHSDAWRTGERAVWTTGAQKLIAWRSAVELRRRVHESLRELALAVIESAFGQEDLRKRLSEALVLEEEVGGVRGQIAALEKSFERIRFEAGERATSLRYAITDLSLERSLLTSPGNPQQLADLEFQIGTLERRLREVNEDRQRQTQALAEDVQRLRLQEQRAEQDLARVYHELGALVETARPLLDAERFTPLFAELDALRRALGQAQSSLPAGPT